MPADEIRLPAEDEPELFFTADEAGAAAEAEIEAREFSTPLPPDVVEEMVQIRRKLMKFKEKKIPEIEDQLSLFINDWRSQTKDESEELKKLKDRVAIRRAQRAEEQARLDAIKQEEEELRLREEEEERIRKEEEKIKRLQDAELRRRKMIEEQSKGRDFKIASTTKEAVLDPKDFSKEPTKEEYEMMRNAALSVITRPMEIDSLDRQHIHMRCDDLWKKIVKLETERYDIEDRIKRQEYDLKELRERRKQQLKQKALKLGLPPEALTGKYPPKIQVASKYERRKGLLSFGDTKGRFEGGIVEEYKVQINENWTKRQDVFTKKNPGEIPPWLEDMGSRLVVEDEVVKDEPEPEVVEDIAEVEAVEGGAENTEITEVAEIEDGGIQEEVAGENVEAEAEVEKDVEVEETKGEQEAANSEEAEQETGEIEEEGEGEEVETEAEPVEEGEPEENLELDAEAEEGADEASPPPQDEEAEEES